MRADARSPAAPAAPSGTARRDATREVERADERVLVDRVRNGDESAFETIFRGYFQSLLTFAQGYVHSRALAEELVQEVFLRIWANRADWVVETSVRAYLFGAVRNRALNQLDRDRVDHRWRLRAVGDESGMSVSGRIAGPEQEVIANEIGAAVRVAIDALPERARMAATLRWREGLRYAEIADAMGISRKGVENQLARVAKILRDKLAAHRV